MSQAECSIRVGTSGWYYDHWAERFYPPDLPKGRWLQYYAEHFDTVEINNTFYYLPKEQTMQRWYKLVLQCRNSFLSMQQARHVISVNRSLCLTARTILICHDFMSML